jgi:hypothetical protein
MIAFNDSEVATHGGYLMLSFKRLTAVTFAAALAFFGLTSPASANDTRYDGPYACGPTSLQSCGYGQVRDSHQIVDACDTRADGYGYVVLYRRKNDGSGYGEVRDGNGSASGCGIKRVGTSSNPIVEYNVCSDQGILFCMGSWKRA